MVAILRFNLGFTDWQTMSVAFFLGLNILQKNGDGQRINMALSIGLKTNRRRKKSQSRVWFPSAIAMRTVKHMVSSRFLRRMFSFSSLNPQETLMKYEFLKKDAVFQMRVDLFYAAIQSLQQRWYLIHSSAEKVCSLCLVLGFAGPHCWALLAQQYRIKNKSFVFITFLTPSLNLIYAIDRNWNWS